MLRTSLLLRPITNHRSGKHIDFKRPRAGSSNCPKPLQNMPIARARFRESALSPARLSRAGRLAGISTHLGDSKTATRRIRAGHRSRSEADWAYAKRSLARGDSAEQIIQRIADYRADGFP